MPERSESDRPRLWLYRVLAALAVAVLALGGGEAAAAAGLLTAGIYLAAVLGGLIAQGKAERSTWRGLWPAFTCLEVGASAFVVARTGPTAAPLLLLLALPVMIWGLLRQMPGGLWAAGVAIAAEAGLLAQAAGSRTGPGTWGWGAAFGAGAYHAASLLLLGAVSGLLGRRIQREEAIHLSTRAELERMRLDADSILAHLSHGLLCLDPAERITRGNAEAGRLLGIAGTADSPETLDELAARPAARELALHLRGRLRAPEEATHEFLLEGRPLEVTTTPLRDERGEPRGLVVLLNDLTERRAQEEERRARERLAFIGELSAGLAHEIRNSLKPITGSVELLRREIPSGEAARDTLMEIILREAESLENFLTEFLVFTRDRATPREVVALEAILGEELESLSALGGSAFRLARPGPGGIPLHVRADRSGLRQIVRNLGLNALETGSRTIEVGWRRLGQEAEIFVEDHGPGVPEEIRARVFDPFFTTKPSGTGLGLAIARDLVDRFGGRLLLLPAEGGGTRASIRLPLVAPAEAPEAEAEAASAA